VFWRFKFLVLAGFVLACVLATLSVAKVSLAHGRPVFAHRQAQLWVAQETLLLTQQGFPEGRTIFPKGPSRRAVGLNYLSARLASLAVFYAQLANSDTVRSRIPAKRIPVRKDELNKLVIAAPVVSNIGNPTPLPMLTFTGEATTRLDAIKLTRVVSGAFRSYVAQQQIDAGVPDNERVFLSVLSVPGSNVVAQPRKKIIPLMVFMAVVVATLGLALILDNIMLRARVVELAPEQDLAAEHRPRHSPIAGVGRADAGG
jgi:hypothetical protein